MIVWKRPMNDSSVSRRWQTTSFGAQFFGSGRRTSTASGWPEIAAARSSAARVRRRRRSSSGILATSSIVSMRAPSRGVDVR